MQLNDSNDTSVVKYQKIATLKNLLYSSAADDDKNISKPTKTYNCNQVTSSETEMLNLSFVNTIQNNGHDHEKDVVSRITCVVNKDNKCQQIFNFEFKNDEIMKARRHWMELMYANIVNRDEIVNIPVDIWDIIIKQYCCWDTTTIENITVNDEILADFKLYYIKYLFLKPKYFDHYRKMYQFLQIYAAFKICQEMIYFILFLIYFFTHQEHLDLYTVHMSSGWERFQQVMATLTNFYFMPIHPLCIFYSLYIPCLTSQCCNDEHEDYVLRRCIEENHPKLNLTYPGFLQYEKIRRQSQDSHEYKETKLKWEQYAHFMSNWPPILKYLLIFYWIKTAVFMMAYVVLAWIPVLFLCYLLLRVAGDLADCKCSNSCKQKMKMILYFATVFAVMFGVFFAINIYDGHMFVAAVVRSFLAVDQCPRGVTDHWFDNFIFSNHYHFNDSLQIILWLNQWII